MTVAHPFVAAALRLLVALAGLLLTAPLLSAQVSSGSFYGSIDDPSGGLLAAAQIEIRQEKTGFVRRTSIGTTGLYRLPDLAPGIYSVTVQRNGFRTSVAPHVSLEINQEARVDFRLEIGAAHETVTVAASASPSRPPIVPWDIVSIHQPSRNCRSMVATSSRWSLWGRVQFRASWEVLSTTPITISSRVPVALSP